MTDGGAEHSGSFASASLSEAERVALQHSWDWFALHSGQRMQLISFYFVAQALIVAGYGTSLQADTPVAALGLAAAGLFLNIGFYLADVRTRELVKASEPALAHFESRLASVTGRSELPFVAGVERPGTRGTSYSSVVGLFVATMSLLLLAALAFAIVEIARDDKPAEPPGPPRSPAAAPGGGTPDVELEHQRLGSAWTLMGVDGVTQIYLH